MLANIQLLRAVAVLLVIGFHIEGYMHRLYPDSVRLLWHVGYSGVDLFFVISGFINSYVSVERWHERSYGRIFILRRLIRILPNYWIILIPTAYLVYAHGLRPADMVDPLASVLLVWPQHLTEHLMIPAWTLNYELYFYIALAVLMLRPRLILAASIGWFVLVAVAQYWMDYSNIIFAWSFVLSPYWLQFVAGLWIGLLARRGSMPFAGLALCYGVLMWGVAIAVNVWVYPEGFANPFHRDLRVWLYLLAYAPILYALVSWELGQKWICRRITLIRIGDDSYSLYLWMTPFLFAWHWLAGEVWSVQSLWQVLLYGALMLLSLIGFTRYYCLRVEKPLLRWMNHKLAGYYGAIR